MFQRLHLIGIICRTIMFLLWFSHVVFSRFEPLSRIAYVEKELSKAPSFYVRRKRGRPKKGTKRGNTKRDKGK